MNQDIVNVPGISWAGELLGNLLGNSGCTWDVLGQHMPSTLSISLQCPCSVPARYTAPCPQCQRRRNNLSAYERGLLDHTLWDWGGDEPRNSVLEISLGATGAMGAAVFDHSVQMEEKVCFLLLITPYGTLLMEVVDGSLVPSVLRLGEGSS